MLVQSDHGIRRTNADHGDRSRNCIGDIVVKVSANGELVLLKRFIRFNQLLVLQSSVCGQLECLGISPLRRIWSVNEPGNAVLTDRKCSGRSAANFDDGAIVLLLSQLLLLARQVELCHKSIETSEVQQLSVMLEFHRRD